MQEPSDATAKPGLLSGRSWSWKLGRPTKLCPSVMASVDVEKIEARFLQVGTEIDVPEISQFLNALVPGSRKGMADAVEDDLPSDVIEVEQAASR